MSFDKNNKVIRKWKKLPVKYWQYLLYNLAMLIKIWNVRTEKEITLSELAQRCGISRAALSNYENEIRYPTVLQMEKIAKALDVRISDLYESDYK